MAPRAAFLTIGQTPRTDVLPEILAQTRTNLAVTECGALDDLDDGAISTLAPRDGEERLVTRLRNGREVFLSKARMDERLHVLAAKLDGQGYDLIVLLCTAPFTAFRTRAAFIEPQHAVDHFLQGVGYGAETVGVLLPSPDQIAEFHGVPGLACVPASASPFAPTSGDELRSAAKAISDTDIIVMHCIAYTEAQAALVKAVSGRPVLLSRRVVAHAIDLLLA